MAETKATITDLDTPILIVDDSASYTHVLTKMLRYAFGYRNITALDSTGEAFKVIAAQPDRFKLLFIDFFFPDGDTGASLLERLRVERLLEGKAAFLITSEPSLENVGRATSAGAIGVVAKPFDRAELKKQIDKANRALFADRVDYF